MAGADELPRVLIALMKGVIYREDDVALWQLLIGLRARVQDYVSVLTLQLEVDESEGYAYLRQRDMGDREGTAAQKPVDGTMKELPRLVPRRQLGYAVSLLLALLRKRLAEWDAKTGDTRLVVSREDIIELVRVFMPAGTNEARISDRLDEHISRIIALGFLRPLKPGQAGGGETGVSQFEVRRILKAFVDAQWLNEFDARLAVYRGIAGGTERHE